MAGNTSQIALKSSVRYHTLMEIRERKTIVALIYFALAALVSGGSLYGNCAPFGAAFVGASGAGLPGVCALLGAGLGYHAAFGFSESAEYIASCVMIYTVAFVCQYLPFFKKKFFMPGVVICVMGITMAFGSISTVREDTPYLARMVIEVWLSGCFTFLYGSFFLWNCTAMG